MYDVAIIGAGPAGSSLTYFLTDKGFKVLTIERDRTPALRTICGEYLPDPKSIPIDGDLASAYYSYFEPFILHKISKITLKIKNRSFSSNFIGYSIDRKLMIRERLREAVDEGAELKTGEAFIDFDKSEEGLCIKTLRGKYIARYIIGADGFESRVSKAFRLYDELKCDDVALAFSEEINLYIEEPEEMQLLVDETLAPGTYAWIIPRSPERANIGVGVRLNLMKGFNAGSSLRELIKTLNVKGNPKIRIKGRFVPVGGMKRYIAGGGVFLIGDAARMTIPSNGGGMHTSIIAAYLLAQSMESSDPASYYADKVHEIIFPMVKTGLVHRKAADFLTKTRLLWKTVDILPEGIVQEVIEVRRGKYFPLLRALAASYELIRGKVDSYPLC